MKKVVIFSFLCILCIGGIFMLIKSNTNKNTKPDETEIPVQSKTNNDLLINLGYSDSDIEIINNKLSNSNINYLLNIPYNENYINIIKEDDFDSNKLNNYIDYFNKFNSNISDTIILVNKNLLDYYDTRLVSLINETYYKDDNFKRYFNYLTNYPKLSTSTIVSYINSNLDYDYYETDYPTDLNKDYLMIVNKYYMVGSSYTPNNLVHITSTYGGNGQYIQNEAYNSYIKMFNDMKKIGLNLIVRSSYRSYSYQTTLYNNYVARDGKEAADTYSARPGYSEHQTGLAIDVGTPSTSNLGDFENTEEFKWMQENAHKYGFILRYPSDKVLITGYQYEPWHYRYVGVDVATKIKNTGLTYEEYYEYYLK